jgi:hypothetical protein
MTGVEWFLIGALFMAGVELLASVLVVVVLYFSTKREEQGPKW